jgi:hypothetical protein
LSSPQEIIEAFTFLSFSLHLPLSPHDRRLLSCLPKLDSIKTSTKLLAA